MCWRLSINTAVFVATNTKHIIKNVHQFGHLAEDEYLAILTNQLRDQVVKNLKLHRGVDNVVAINKWWARLNVFKQVWMITNFLKLHQYIMQLDAIFAVIIIYRRNIASQYLFVQLLLQLC